MDPLPFKIRQDTETERWRARTFLEKEPETLAWIDHFNPDDVFFDVGANIGIYSLYCAYCHPRSTIYAFEPAISNYSVLVKNAKSNHFRNLHCELAAVGNQNGLVKFMAPFSDAGATGGQIAKHGVVTPVITLDSWPVQPDHVKIDIDGQELDVVLGMREILKTVKSVLVEVTDKSKQPVQSIFREAGFTKNNRHNRITPHSRDRRSQEGIEEENIIFTRVTL